MDQWIDKNNLSKDEIDENKNAAKSNGALFSSKEQKWFGLGFAIFAIFAFVLGFLSFKQNLRISFILSDQHFSEEAAKANGYKDLFAGAQAEQIASRNKDTDHDGLSDWEEVNLYKTSPYITDTDGDGVPDGAEVKNGTDPNCPTGKTCAAEIVGTNASASSSSSTTDDFKSTAVDMSLFSGGDYVQALNQFNNGVMSTSGAEQLIKSSINKYLPSPSSSPAEIKKGLINLGVKEEDLKGLSDDQLRQIVEKILSSQDQLYQGQL